MRKLLYIIITVLLCGCSNNNYEEYPDRNDNKYAIIRDIERGQTTHFRKFSIELLNATNLIDIKECL